GSTVGQVTLTAEIAKIRLFAFALIVRLSAPGPTIDTEREIWICPVVSRMVPVNPGVKFTMFGPGAVALALAIAARRLPAPLLPRLVTVNVAGGAPAAATVKVCVAWGAAL